MYNENEEGENEEEEEEEHYRRMDNQAQISKNEQLWSWVHQIMSNWLLI